ncbi:MAG: hypothetical protein N4A33_01030 [Bacteriovoracaceae bacterium]|jgi:hypothetical protein|nr:hypothetical protein [Bacteriovoracaceae bacterium]
MKSALLLSTLIAFTLSTNIFAASSCSRGICKKSYKKSTYRPYRVGGNVTRTEAAKIQSRSYNSKRKASSKRRYSK